MWWRYSNIVYWCYLFNCGLECSKPASEYKLSNDAKWLTDINTLKALYCYVDIVFEPDWNYLVIDTGVGHSTDSESAAQSVVTQLLAHIKSMVLIQNYILCLAE